MQDKDPEIIEKMKPYWCAPLTSMYNILHSQAKVKVDLFTEDVLKHVGFFFLHNGEYNFQKWYMQVMGDFVRMPYTVFRQNNDGTTSTITLGMSLDEYLPDSMIEDVQFVVRHDFDVHCDYVFQNRLTFYDPIDSLSYFQEEALEEAKKQGRMY